MDPARCLRATRDEPAGAVDIHDRPANGPDSGRVLACAACALPVTTTAARIEQGGSHEHRFTNPHGFEFRIGCFSAAPGCATEGEPSTFFTWFPGCSWQVERCARCGAHLGWLFRSTDRRFHGLILDRLVEADPRES